MMTLTLWTSLVHAIYGTLAMWSSFLCFFYIEQQSSALITDKKYVQCRRICVVMNKVQSIAPSLGITVVIAFWGMLWKYADLNDPTTYQTHGIVAILVTMDYYLSYSRMGYKSTFVYLIGFCMLYAVWSIVYQLITRKAIYVVIDWIDHPVAAVITVVSVSVLAQLTQLLLCWSKNKLITRVTELSKSDEDKVEVGIMKNGVEATVDGDSRQAVVEVV